MADFLEQKRKEIEGRLSELRPLIEEARQLEAAAAALAGVGVSKVKAVARRGPGRPRGSANKTSRTTSATKRSSGRRGRPRGSGTRAAQALELVKAQPGITITELAEKMGIKQNYLYRVLPVLEAERKVTKKGRGWHPRQSA
jgi:CRP-like cAMP-binding protein